MTHVDRLNTIRDRTRSARERVSHARQQRQAAMDRAQALPDLPRPGSPEAMELFRADSDLRAAEAELEACKDEESWTLSRMAGVNGALRGDSFLRNTERLSQLERLGHSRVPIGRQDLGVGVDADELLAMIQSGDWGTSRMAAAGFVTTTDEQRADRSLSPVVAAPRRALRLLDLIPSQPMTGNSFVYSQEVAVDGASEVADGAVKPTAQIDYTDATAEAHTIAHWLKLQRQQLADVPGLQQAVQSRLTYGVLKRLEDQVLAGNGTGENIRGILATTGTGVVAFNAGVPIGELPLEAIVDVIMVDATPTGVVLNPTDWAKIATDKTSGSGDYYGGGPFGSAPSSLWGLPAIPSKAITAGTALVGDFANGCTLFVREGVNVRMSDSDEDDFVRNRLTLLGEGRFAFAVWSPASFVSVDLAA